jgi:hypothetical protein
MNGRNTTCDHALERLPLYVGDELDAESSAGVSAHLEVCAGCRGAARRASEARARLRAAFEEDVRGGGPSLWRGVRAGLVREGLLQPERAPILRGPWRRAAALAAAAAGLALIAAPALFRRSGGDDGATADLVHNAALSAVAEPEAAGPADAAVVEPAPSGLVPIHSLRERLSTQPIDPRYELTSSPVR